MVVTSMAFLPRRAGDGGSLPKSISFVINFAAGKELAPLKIRTGNPPGNTLRYHHLPLSQNRPLMRAKEGQEERGGSKKKGQKKPLPTEPTEMYLQGASRDTAVYCASGGVRNACLFAKRLPHRPAGSRNGKTWTLLPGQLLQYTRREVGREVR